MNKNYPIVFYPQKLKEVFGLCPPLPDKPLEPQKPKEPYKPIEEKETVGGCLIYLFLISIPSYILIVYSSDSIIVSIIMLLAIIGLIRFYYYYNIKPKYEYPNMTEQYNTEYSKYQHELVEFEKSFISYSLKLEEYESEVKNILSTENVLLYRNKAYKYLTNDNYDNFINFPTSYNYISKQNVSLIFFREYLNDSFLDKNVRFGVELKSCDLNILLYEATTNLLINIEIDSPYLGCSGRPINFIESNSDRYPNNSEYEILESNIVIIRFAEVQIFNFPNECIRFIKSIIENAKRGVFSRTLGIGLPDIELWNKEEAHEMGYKKYRNSYIPVFLHKIIDVEGDLFKVNELIHETFFLKIIDQQTELHYIPFRIEKRWTIFDVKKNKIVGSDFDQIYFLDQSLKTSTSCIIEDKGLYSIICNSSNIEELTWYTALIVLKTNKELCIVRNKNLWGIINYKNEIKLNFEFDSIIEFNYLSSFVCCCKYGKYGLIDLDTMKTCIPIEYDKIYRKITDDENILILSKNNNLEYFDMSERRKLKINEAEKITHISEGICNIRLNHKSYLLKIDESHYNYINKIGYDTCSKFENGYSLCSLNDKWFLVDKIGIETPIDYSHITKDPKIKLKKDGNIVTFQTYDAELNYNFYHIFNLDKHISTIKEKRIGNFYSIVPIENKYIEIIGDFWKYEMSWITKYATIYGNDLTIDEFVDYKKIKNKREENFYDAIYNLQYNYIDLNWKIIKTSKEDNLCFKDTIKYTGNSLKIIELNYGLALLLEDVERDEVWYYNIVGYFDVFGKIYWKNC